MMWHKPKKEFSEFEQNVLTATEKSEFVMFQGSTKDCYGYIIGLGDKSIHIFVLKRVTYIMVRNNDNQENELELKYRSRKLFIKELLERCKKYSTAGRYIIEYNKNHVHGS